MIIQNKYEVKLGTGTTADIIYVYAFNLLEAVEISNKIVIESKKGKPVSSVKIVQNET